MEKLMDVMKSVEFKKVSPKESVTIRIRVDEIPSEMVDISLMLRGPGKGEEDHYPFEAMISLKDVYPDRAEEIDAFLSEEESHDPSLFAPEAIASVIMERAHLLLENGGFELNAYLELGSYKEMLSIERDVAEQYFAFKS